MGVPALYCGTSIALCALEKLLHLGDGPQPPLALVAIDMPDVPVYEPDLADLSRDWATMPASLAAQAFGGDWLAGGSELAMKVPSVPIPEESNMVLNPRHADYARVTFNLVRPFAFDERLFKAGPPA